MLLLLLLIAGTTPALAQSDDGFTHQEQLVIAVPPSLFAFFSIAFLIVACYCQPARHPERDLTNNRCVALCTTSSIERIRRLCVLVMWLSVCTLLASWVRLSWTFFAIVLAILCIVWSGMLTAAIRFSRSATEFERSFPFTQSGELRTTFYVLAVFWLISTGVAIYVAVDVYNQAVACGGLTTVTPACFGLVHFAYQIFFIASMLAVAVACVVLGQNWHETCELISVRNEAIRVESRKQRNSMQVGFRDSAFNPAAMQRNRMVTAAAALGSAGGAAACKTSSDSGEVDDDDGEEYDDDDNGYDDGVEDV